MPTIELSPALALNIANRMSRITDATSGVANSAQGGFLGGSSNANTGFGAGAVGTHLYLMKGTIPATASTTANINARLADVLVRFTANGSASGGDFVTSQIVNQNPCIITTQYTAAIASGTATWFWLVTAQGNTNSSTFYIDYAATPLYQAIGTVGLTGSGSDMEMPIVNIVPGEQYRVMNFRLQIPTSWTY